jgi:hypothetical protein
MHIPWRKIMSLFREVKVDYDFSEILAADHDAHAGTCIFHQQKELDDVYQKFGGMPGSFCTENTTLHQLWWSRDQLDYDALGNMVDIEIVTVSSIRQDPGNTIPYHRDMFYKISQAYPERKETKVRANIFLEPGKLGHFLQFTVDGCHNTYTNWKSHTGFVFDSNILHLSSNAGLEPKFTLQISGFWKGQEQ